MSAPLPKNRFGRVTTILNDAAAGADTSAYGDAGRFWDLPCETFVKAKIFGVPLIAPVVQKSCCGGGERRSGMSSLIRALRGEPPFDGGRFPPFMWGGGV